MRTVFSATKSFLKFGEDLKLEMAEKDWSVAYGGWPSSSGDADNAEAVVVSTQKVDGASLERLKKLKLIVKYGAGTDNIDLEAAKKRGIAVGTTGDANSNAVAELAFTLLLALNRGIAIADRSIRKGGWERIVGRELDGMTIGVIGMGAIGKAFIRKVTALGSSVIAEDPYWDEEFAHRHSVRKACIDTIFAEADAISLHCPLTPETRGLVNGTRLAMMKKEACVINTSRGAVVDEEALAEAIASGKIAGAAIDVFKQEPPEGSPLLGLDRVLLTSHMGAYTREAFRRMDRRVMDQIIAEGGK